MNSFTKIAVCAAILSAVSLTSSAQSQKDSGQSWRERIMSEKIAFLTTAIGLTPEEAQAFWPVYNQLYEERGKAQYEVMMAYKTLAKAVDENKTKEIPDLLENYLDAIKAKDKLENSCAEKYGKVLPPEKVAKLYVGEERFRRQQIHKLHNNK